MMPELGHFALILALCIAIIQAIIPLLGAQFNNIAWISLAKPAAWTQFLFIAIAFLCLSYAFLTNDFSVVYVAENSNTHLPLFYKIGAIWGAHSGSLLLWVFILSIWIAAVALFSARLPRYFVARVLAVMGMISCGFLLYLLITSNPFLRWLPAHPANGVDLNPLLQDPGLVIHPPMLYMGYVGFSVAFAFAIAALMEGNVHSHWVKWARPWTLAAWCFLTWGITLGSWWSYRELGWGGWWAWDPVENASFMPWLVGTALIHSLAVTEKRNAFKAWTVLLAIIAFSLSLIGTFLVRSGVLVSIHAFAVSPQRGTFMLVFLAIVIGVSLLLYAWRGHALKSIVEVRLWSRETMLLANNVLLTVAMLTVFIGTLYPLLIQAIGLGQLSVGPPYFNTVFVPLMLPLLILLAVGPLFHWKFREPKQVVRRAWCSLLLSIMLAFVLVILQAEHFKVGAAIGLALAFWIIIITGQELWQFHQGKLRLKRLARNQYAMSLAHVGLAICVIGVVISSSYSIEKDVSMSVNSSIQAGNYQFTFLGVRDITGPNYKGIEGGVRVSQHGKKMALLTPQLWTFSSHKETLSKVAIDVGLFRDIYVALGRPLGNGNWSLRLYVKPFIRWIWVGGILMFLGGVLAIADRRYWNKNNAAKEFAS